MREKKREKKKEATTKGEYMGESEKRLLSA